MSLYAKLVGSEFLVNTQTTSDQQTPAITGLSNGGFVVSWTDNSGTLGDSSASSIKAQVFDAGGAKVGSEFLVNTQTTSYQYSPTISGLSNGGFVVSWQDQSGTLGDASAYSIKAQVFDAGGAKVGSEFLVNTQTASTQASPTITGLSNGGFAVSWYDQSGTLGDSSASSIKAQAFDAAGAKVGSEFLVNTQTTGDQAAPTITGLSSGGFVVSWQDTLGDASGYGIKAQVFDDTGARVGSEFLVNTQTASTQASPTITGLSHGGFAVSWYDLSGTLGDAGGSSIKAQIFSLVEQPALSIAATDAVKAEGNTSSTAFSFTVTRTGDTSGTTTAHYAVTGSGAHPADAADFGGSLPAGTVSFAASETSKVLTINVSGDTAYEPNEGFTVTLSNPSGPGVIQTATAGGTIANDDNNAAPVPGVSQGAMDEDTTVVLTRANFPFTDTENDPITAIRYTNGDAPNLDGEPVYLNQVISIADIDAGKLTFTPSPNASSIYAGFNFTVIEAGGLEATSNGTVVYWVNPVNDPPTLTLPGPITTLQAASVTASVSDPDDGDTFTATVTPPAIAGGAISARGDTGPGGPAWAHVVHNDDGSLTITGSLAQVNASLGTLLYSGSLAGSGDIGITVTDAAGATMTGQVQITVTDSFPTLPATTTVNVVEGATAVTTVQGSDPDAGDTLAYSIQPVHNPDGALFSVDPISGALSFNTPPDYAHPADVGGDNNYVVVVRVTDSQGLAAVETVSVNVTPNQPPTADATQPLTTDEDTDLHGTVSATDPENDALTYAVKNGAGAQHGTVGFTDPADPAQFTYTPNQNYNGSDSFTVQITDGHGHIVEQVENVTIIPVNDAPVGSPTTLLPAGHEDNVYHILGDYLLQGVSDPDGDPLSITGLSADHGTVTPGFTPGRFEFTPDADYNGPVTLSYTVTDGNGASTPTVQQHFTITEENDAPTGVDDPQSTVLEDSGQRTFSFASLLSNDSKGPANESGQHLTITQVGDAVGGTVAIQGTDVVFTPTANFNGQASFTYTLQDDGTTNGAADPKTSTATVGWTITPVNDAPAGAPSATLANGTEDSAQTITKASLLQGFSDVDGDTLDVTGLTADHGAITQEANGNFTFAPDANYNGLVTLTYTVTDGNGGDVTGQHQTFVLQAVNDAPTGPATGTIPNATEDVAYSVPLATLLGGFSDVDGDTPVVQNVSASTGSASIVGPDVKLTFDPNFNGPVTLSYEVADGHGGVASASRTFTIAEVNDAPTGVNDPQSTVLEDSGPRTFSFSDLLANDGTGPANESSQHLTITQASGAVGGAVAIQGTDVVFTPTANYNGPASFTYTLRDDGSTNGAADPKTSTATVSWTITAVNDAPTGAPSATLADGTEDTAQTITKASLVQGFSDVDGDTLSVTGLTATHGVIATKANGDFTFTPDANYNGPVTLNYTVTDGNGGSTPAVHQTFTLTAVNDAPVALNDGSPAAISITEDTATNLTATLLGNDTDVDGDTLTITGKTGASHGTVSLAGGVLTYAPAANYNGADSFTYTVSDGHGGSATATAALNVTAANDAPTAVADTGAVNEDAQVTLNLVGNDTDPDLPYGDSLTIANVSGNLGSVAVSADGKSIIYSADNDQFDLLATGATTTDAFSYTVRDAAGLTSTSTVTMTVKGVADGNTITGGNQADNITVGAGRNNTTSGEDVVHTGNGNDSVAGGDGADQLYGENGDDLLDGGNGIDKLYGGGGNDRLLGGTGNDILQGDQGSDVLTGGAGADTFVFVGGYSSSERDTILDLQAGDRIQLLNGLSVTSAATANLAGTSAADTLLTLSNGSSIVLADISLATWNTNSSGWIIH